MKKTLLGILAVVIVVAGAAFYGGMKYDQSKTLGARQQRLGQFQAGQAGGSARGSFGQTGGGLTRGEIIKKDDASITVKLPDGGSKIIFFSGTTHVGKTVDGSPADLEVGKTVMASGKAGSDGSIAADTIQIQPAELGPK
jgi:hypothetical protein